MPLRPGKGLAPGLAASLELFLHEDGFLNSFSAALGTACLASWLTLASVCSRVPGMHWQHWSRRKENPRVHPLCCVRPAGFQGAW